MSGTTPTTTTTETLFTAHPGARPADATPEVHADWIDAMRAHVLAVNAYALLHESVAEYAMRHPHGAGGEPHAPEVRAAWSAMLDALDAVGEIGEQGRQPQMRREGGALVLDGDAADMLATAWSAYRPSVGLMQEREAAWLDAVLDRGDPA